MSQCKRTETHMIHTVSPAPLRAPPIMTRQASNMRYNDVSRRSMMPRGNTSANSAISLGIKTCTKCSVALRNRIDIITAQESATITPERHAFLADGISRAPNRCPTRAVDPMPNPRMGTTDTRSQLNAIVTAAATDFP